MTSRTLILKFHYNITRIMKVIWCIVLICDLRHHVAGMTMNKCITPPMECPNVNVTFWLYTRANVDDPVEIRADDTDSILSAPWVKGAVTKILIHGYTGDKNFSPNTEIKPAYMKCCDYNIISVDYKELALEPCYVQAAANSELVGKCTAQLIDRLVQHGFELAKFHVIGFSLGGQVAGYIGKYLKGQLDRITGLDPALPLFATTDKQRKLHKGDAKYVDVLHTNSMMRGKLESSGVADFYANGGIFQTGCKSTEKQSSTGCAHARAPEYYAESILTETGFYATKCFSWIFYIIGWCQLFPSDEEVLFGEYVSLNTSGLYFFNTNPDPPYARGPAKSQ